MTEFAPAIRTNTAIVLALAGRSCSRGAVFPRRSKKIEVYRALMTIFSGATACVADPAR